MTFFDPSACRAFERSKESLLQACADEPVGLFDLAVGLGMRHRGVLDLDAKLFSKFLKFTRGEVGAVVGDDVVRYAVPVDDGLEELDRRSCLLIGDRDSFDPFGELIDGDQQVSVASSR
jgi:hypothetical protein